MIGVGYGIRTKELRPEKRMIWGIDENEKRPERRRTKKRVNARGPNAQSRRRCGHARLLHC